MSDGKKTSSPSSALPSGCTTATCPLGGAPPLSKSVLDSIAKCPAMKTDLENLQKDNWKVVWGPAGGGYHTTKGTKTITLDPSIGKTDQKIITMLSHEMGHAKYTQPAVSPVGLTREQYIAASVQAELEDEGDATLSQIQYKECLTKGGGPTVDLWYGKSAEYEAINKKYPNAADRGKARTEIANMYGDNEKPSNCPGQTYRQYYENPCCSPGCGTGHRTKTEALTDDQWKAMGGKI